MRRAQKGHVRSGEIRSVSSQIEVGLSFGGKFIARYDRSTWRHVIRIPKVFSLTKSPDEVIDVLHTLTELGRQGATSFYFDFRECEYLGIAASIVLDVVVLKMRDIWNRGGTHCRFSGTCPTNKEADAIFRSMGMIKQLNIKHMEPSVEEQKRLVKLELIRGRRSSNPLDHSDAERACTQLADYLNTCFETAAGYSLTPEGQRKVMAWAGEIITNAEEHANSESWWAIGYMRLAKSQMKTWMNPEGIGECHLVIFNFGRSIHESLMDEATPLATREALTNLVNIHRSQSLFSFMEKYSEADLVTLYSLQEGVSCCNTAPGKEDRGNGTVRLISVFQDLGNSVDREKSTRMALLSGGTRILFTDEYQMQKRGDRMTIAFNEDNDLYKRPCKDHVHSLRGKFPGTLLSFNFYVDRRYLDKLKNQNEY